MAQKPGSLVVLKCENEDCSRSFTYRLTTSPFRKKFCPDCAAHRTYENKRRFDEKRKRDDIDRARCRKALTKVDDREINPARLVDMAMKMVT